MAPKLCWMILLCLIWSSALAVNGDEVVQTTILDVTDQNRGAAEFRVSDAPSYINISLEILEDVDGFFDPVMWIVDSEDRLIAYRDNAIDDNSPRIDRLLLLPDTYTILVDSFNGVFDATVALRIETVDPFDVRSESGESSIRQIVTLPDSTVYRYALDVSAGQLLTITARDLSGTLDPVLTVRSAEMEDILASNDDHGAYQLDLNVLDSQISQWVVPATQIVIIEVHDFLGMPGQFELVITRSS